MTSGKAVLSALQFQPAHEVALSKRCALMAENVVSRGRVEKEVRQRERHQETFRRERRRASAEPEGDIAADQRIDRVWRQHRQFQRALPSPMPEVPHSPCLVYP